jgi:hypothetical protein
LRRAAKARRVAFTWQTCDFSPGGSSQLVVSNISSNNSNTTFTTIYIYVI